MTVEPISRLVAMDSAEDIRRQEEVECAISRLVGNSSKDMAIVRLVPREEEEARVCNVVGCGC